MPTVEELLAVAESEMDAKQTEQYPIEVLNIDAKNKRDTDTRWELLFGVESDEKAERNGLTDDLKNKIDIFFATGRITEEQYNELMNETKK